MVLKQLVERAASHPKMESLLKVVLHHFQPQGSVATAAANYPTAAVGDPTAVGVADNTHDVQEDQPGRVIIFTNRRDSVQSIVDMLRAHEPTVTAR